jgi:hypothetical protein
MVTTALVVLALGAGSVVLGVLGLRGRLPRVPITTMARVYAMQVLVGGALVGMGLIVLLEDHTAVAGLLLLPTLVLAGLGIWTAIFRAPRWLEPQWQRDFEGPERRMPR